MKAFKKLAETIAILKASEEIAKKVAGKKLESEMKRTIDEELVDWPPLSSMTISIKGHSKPLIDSGKMRNSIEYRDEGSYITVGVHSDAPENRALIALVHEHGAPEQHIPPRPFIQPTWDREKTGITLLFDETMKGGL